jgi:hypothetical protein
MRLIGIVTQLTELSRDRLMIQFKESAPDFTLLFDAAHLSWERRHPCRRAVSRQGQSRRKDASAPRREPRHLDALCAPEPMIPVGRHSVEHTLPTKEARARREHLRTFCNGAEDTRTARLATLDSGLDRSLSLFRCLSAPIRHLNDGRFSPAVL